MLSVKGEPHDEMNNIEDLRVRLNEAERMPCQCTQIDLLVAEGCCCERSQRINEACLAILREINSL